MSGGGGKPPAYQPIAQDAVQVEPVPETQLRTSGYGGMGYTPTPQTYTPWAAPQWMQGQTIGLRDQGFQGLPDVQRYSPGGKAVPNWYQTPQWGADARTGEALTQSKLNPWG